MKYRVVLIVLPVFLAVTAGWMFTATVKAPAIIVSPPVTDPITSAITTMSLKEKISQLLVLHVSGKSGDTLSTYVKTYKPAGLILMGDNIPDTISELRTLTEDIRKNTSNDFPYLIATDQEGCTVKRLKQDDYLCAMALGKSPITSTTKAFAMRSDLLQQGGINVNFGIVADITSDQNSFIYPRVFSGNPTIAGDRVKAAIEGSEGKTLSTIKHFPGHGETAENSHFSVPQTNISKEAWLKGSAIPFKEGIDADLVMFSHLIYTSVDDKPATLSKEWHRILTEEFGYKGLSITDDMIMLQESGDPAYADPIKNAIAALDAGNDLLLFVNNHGSKNSQIDIDALVAGIEDAVKDGRLKEGDIDTKLDRVLRARSEL